MGGLLGLEAGTGMKRAWRKRVLAAAASPVGAHAVASPRSRPTAGTTSTVPGRAGPRPGGTRRGPPSPGGASGRRLAEWRWLREQALPAGPQRPEDKDARPARGVAPVTRRGRGPRQPPPSPTRTPVLRAALPRHCPTGVLNGFPSRNSILGGQHGSGRRPVRRRGLRSPRRAPDLTDTCPRPTRGTLRSLRSCRTPIGQRLPGTPPIGPHTKTHLPPASDWAKEQAKSQGSPASVAAPPLARLRTSLCVLIHLYIGQSRIPTIIGEQTSQSLKYGTGKRRG